MQRQLEQTSRGFSLLEMMVSLALGLLVIGTAVQLFSTGMGATWTISQRAQMQQDARAGLNILTKDVTLAGAGMDPGGVGLVSGASGTPRYGCDYTAKCYLANGSGVNFPCVGSPCVPTLYSVLPGYLKGGIVNSSQGATDAITVTYLDNDFPLNQYKVTISGSVATFTTPSPAPSPALPAVTDTAVGLQLGDLVLFSGTVSGTTATVLGEVTNMTGASSPFQITFANTDPMHLNQAMPNIAGGTNISANRIWMVTYYLDVNPDPTGAGAGTPRLMRQVNGRKTMPVAENVSDLRFTYDIYDENATPPNQSGTLDANLSSGSSPVAIRKINIKHMTYRSLMAGTKGYQGYDIQTSISARNLGFTDRYPGTFQ